MRKIILAFLFLMMSNIVIVGCNNAQPISAPIVPEFDLEYANHRYYVEPSNFTDEYTGQVTIHKGYWMDNQTIDVSIKNQPCDYSGYCLFYNIRFKPHFGNNWECYSSEISDYYFQQAHSGDYWNTAYPKLNDSVLVSPLPATDTQYTILSYDVNSYAENSQIDYQVQEVIGSYSERFVLAQDGWPWGGHNKTFIIHYASSNWSDTQTITIPVASPTPNGSSIAQFTFEALSNTIMIIVLIFTVMVIALVIIRRRTRHTLPDGPNASINFQL